MDHIARQLYGCIVWPSYVCVLLRGILFEYAEFTSEYIESTTIITSTPEDTTVQTTQPEETTDKATTQRKETTTVQPQPPQTTQPTEETTEKPTTESGATEARTVIAETTSEQQTTSSTTGSISTPVGGREFSLLLFFSHHIIPVFHFIQRGSSMQFSSDQDGSSALAKAHMRSTASLRRFHGTAFETLPMLVCLTTALSHFFKADRERCCASLCQAIDGMMFLALCPQIAFPTHRQIFRDASRLRCLLCPPACSGQNIHRSLQSGMKYYEEKWNIYELAMQRTRTQHTLLANGTNTPNVYIQYSIPMSISSLSSC